MDVHEALYTTRMMRRMRPDPIPRDVQARILDAAIRAPTGGNVQRWHFLLVDDPDLKTRIQALYQEGNDIHFQDVAAGRLGFGRDPETTRKLTGSGLHLAEHLAEAPLLVFVFAIDDHGGANIYPAVWSVLLAARAEGVGGALTTILRHRADEVNRLLGVPADEGWTLSAMLPLGYPTGRWGVAANRLPVPEVSSRNHWGEPVGLDVDGPLWTGDRRDGS